MVRVAHLYIPKILVVVFLIFSGVGNLRANQLSGGGKFKPTLQHILLPRKTIDICGNWGVCIQKKNDKPPKSSDFNINVEIPGVFQELFNRAGDEGAVWFQKEIDFSHSIEGKKIRICFEQVTDVCTLYVNGTLVGANTDCYLPFEYSIEDYIKNGKNTIWLKVENRAQRDFNDRPLSFTWLNKTYLGVPLPVHIEISDQLFISDVTIQTKVSPRKQILVSVDIKNSSQVDQEVTLKISVVGKEKPFSPKRLVATKGKSVTFKWAEDWPEAELWDPSSPKLQNLDVCLYNKTLLVDAYRQRFGFREISILGHDMLLNGKKFVLRRNSILSYYRLLPEDNVRSMLKLLRERGYVGSRSNIAGLGRFVNIADEEGWMWTPICFRGPHADVATDLFWDNAKKRLEKIVKVYKNNPSIIYWCPSVEFGSFYQKNQSSAVLKETIAKSLNLAKNLEKLDPSRFWCFDGEGELSFPLRGKGPMPVRSFHYPWSVSIGNREFPATAYWLSDKRVPWQGLAWDKSKPMFLSEDLYPKYAFNPPLGMTRWGGDEVFDPHKGFYDAWYYALSKMAEGYYFAEVSTWTPWACSATIKGFPLFEKGAFMPDYLISVREPGTHFFSGEKAVRTVYVYNQWFKDIDAQVEFTLSAHGKVLQTIKHPANIKSGHYKNYELSLLMPESINKEKIVLRGILKIQNKVLADQKYTFYTYPKKNPNVKFTDTALVAQKSTAILSAASFDKGRYDNIDEALSVKPLKLIICEYKISQSELEKIRIAIDKGLQVLILEATGTSETPLIRNKDTRRSFGWKRSDAALVNITNEDLQIWRPDNYLCKSSYYKPENTDCDVLVDIGGTNGLKMSPLIRVYSGKGSWILCQIPVITRLNQEPAAGFLLTNLLTEFSRQKNKKREDICLLVGNGNRISEYLSRNQIPYTQEISQDKILIIDGSCDWKSDEESVIKKQCNKGGKILIIEPNFEKSNFLKSIGLSLTKSHATEICRIHNRGLTAGLSNDDLFWRQDNKFFDYIVNNGRGIKNKLDRVSTAMLCGELHNKKNGDTELFTTPAGIAACNIDKGMIVVSTLKYFEFEQRKPWRSIFSFRNLINNMGGKTSIREKQSRFKQIDLSAVVNRGFWNRPNRKDLPVGWFGGDNDMRYFPVNRPGFDPELNMPQPAEAFPSGLFNYAGTDFRILDPDKNKGASCLVLEKGKSVTIQVNSVALSAYMLGAFYAIPESGKKDIAMTVFYDNGGKEEVTITAGVHAGGYRYFTNITKGNVGWTGYTQKDKGAVLWCWNLKLTKKESEVKNITLKNTTNVPFALVALTIEKK